MLAAKLRQAALKLFTQFLEHKTVEGHLAFWLNRQQQSLAPIKNTDSPYYQYPQKNDASLRGDIVFITSRFRSGSTALWNLFRQSEGFTSYYEPFNERKWFDSAYRGNRVDGTHLGVSDYWAEYDGLDSLDSLYSESWIDSDLHMDAASWNPSMKEYIVKLVEHAPERPVLQFNRIDFRLGWIKHHFPNAKLIHLHRNPRDQWLSFLTDKALMNSQDVAHNYQDAFYLNSWCRDLSRFFPFLNADTTPHPYQRFYYLWKLSYLYGTHFADLSFSLEDMTHNTAETMTRLQALLNLEGQQVLDSKSLQKAKLGKWMSYADEAWFVALEAECEETITDFLKSR